MLGWFPAKNFQPLPRLFNRYPITRMIPVLTIEKEVRPRNTLIPPTYGATYRELV